MPSKTRSRLILAALPVIVIAGCARPGPPRAPSLRIPAPVSDLVASRIGSDVELRFTAPVHATDGIALPAGDLRGVLCRQLGTPNPANCVAVASLNTPVGARPVLIHDFLPPALTSGVPQLLSYRVELFNAAGTSAGPSTPAYTAAGPAPAPVKDLTANGARNGIVLSWKSEGPATDDVLLERTAPTGAPAVIHPQPAGKPALKPHRAAGRAVAPQPVPGSVALPNVVQLQTYAEAGHATLDATVEPDTPYNYLALRRRMVQIGGQRIEIRSTPSASLPYTLLQAYPPTVPIGLYAAAYFEPHAPSGGAGSPPSFAVDLVWQPVDDDTRIAPLAGYNIYRETLNVRGGVLTPRTRLNSVPAALPAFHDATALTSGRYRYSVTAQDTRGNESAAVTKVLEPQAGP